jgi:hypothetical protein
MPHCLCTVCVFIAPPVFMRISLSYIGCSVMHSLSEDEVYVTRPNEDVTRYVYGVSVQMVDHPSSLLTGLNVSPITW